MNRFPVNDENREFLLDEFIDNLVMNMHISDIQSYAAEWLHQTYNERTNIQLQAEINHRCPWMLNESLPSPYRRE